MGGMDANEAKQRGTFDPGNVRPMDPPPEAGNGSNPRNGSVAGPQVFDALADVWRPICEWGEWLTQTPPRREYLLTFQPQGTEKDGSPKKPVGVLPLGKAGMIAAAGAAGKSWAMIQLALSVATGKPWFGFDVSSPGRVLLVLAEEEAQEAWRRLNTAADAMELSPEERRAATARVWVVPLAGRNAALTGEEPTLRAPGAPKHPADGLPVTALFWEFWERLEQPGEAWRLVVLDPLARMAGLEVEKDNAAATRFVQAVEALTAAPGAPTVLVTHHTNKNSRTQGHATTSDAAAATAARGASALTDGFRWAASLEPRRRYEGEPELVQLRVVKNNYGGYPPETELVRRGGPLTPATSADLAAWKKADKEAKAKTLADAAAVKAEGRRLAKLAKDLEADAREDDTADEADDWTDQ